MVFRAALALMVSGLLAGSAARADEGWALLQDRAIGLMRHGGAVVAPAGTIAPVPGCDTGAILTPEGREEMRRWGVLLRDRGIGLVQIRTSRQCSAWETALLLGLGPVTPDPSLDPAERPGLEGRLDGLRRSVMAALAMREEGGDPVIFITHRATILQFTGLELSHGEVLLLGRMPGGLRLLGRIAVE
jgi:broad specificity phosphatase PhoE